jgi:hypothetical protein
MLTIRQSILLYCLCSITTEQKAPASLRTVCRLIGKIESNIIPSEHTDLNFLEDELYILNSGSLDRAERLICLDLKNLVSMRLASRIQLSTFSPSDAGHRVGSYFAKARLGLIASIIDKVCLEFVQAAMPRADANVQAERV